MYRKFCKRVILSINFQDFKLIYNRILSKPDQMFQQEPNELDQQFDYTNNLYGTPQKIQKNIYETSDNIVSFQEPIAKINFFQEPCYWRPNPSKVTKTPQIPKLPLQNVSNQRQIQTKLLSEESQLHLLKDDQTQCCLDSESIKSQKSIKQKSIKKLDHQNQNNKREQYPTKNFLPACRPFFLKCLASHFDPQYFNNIPIIKKIQTNFGINMRDFQEIFNVVQFRPILERYFKQKQIYRDLMLSRISSDRKRNYLRKLNIFEKAFISKRFTRIN